MKFEKNSLRCQQRILLRLEAKTDQYERVRLPLFSFRMRRKKSQRRIRTAASLAQILIPTWTKMTTSCRRCSCRGKKRKSLLRRRVAGATRRRLMTRSTFLHDHTMHAVSQDPRMSETFVSVYRCHRSNGALVDINFA